MTKKQRLRGVELYNLSSISESMDNTLPKFSWNMTGSTEPDGPFLLNVEFDDGTKDVAELFPYRYNYFAMEKGTVLNTFFRNNKLLSPFVLRNGPS